MKNLLTTLLFILLGCGATAPTYAALRTDGDKKDEAFKQEIIKRVEAKRFRIHINEAAGSHNSSGMVDGSIAIHDSLVISNLPYYGKMRSTVVDPSQLSLNFEAPTIDYISSIIYDGTAKILFDAEKGSEHFVFYIEISPEGEATVTVRSDKRTPAAYSGQFEY